MRHRRWLKYVFYTQLKSKALPLTIFETSHADLEIVFIQRRTISMHRLNQYFGHMTKLLSRRRPQIIGVTEKAAMRRIVKKFSGNGVRQGVARVNKVTISGLRDCAVASSRFIFLESASANMDGCTTDTDTEPRSFPSCINCNLQPSLEKVACPSRIHQGV